jgi:hypothetical protein
MKILKIYQNGSSVPIILTDDDDSDLSEYSKKVSNVLESKNVVILNVSSGSLVLRPHTVPSILISDDKEIESISLPEESIDFISEDIIEDPIEEKKEEPIDTITEID